WLIGAIVVVLIALVTLPSFFFMSPASIPASGGGGVADMLVIQTQVVSIGAKETVVTAIPSTAPGQPQPERLIIRNGSIILVVQDTHAAQQSVEQIVAELAGEGAFVVSSSERSSGDEQSPYINL